MKTIIYLGLPTPYSLPIQSKAVNLEGNSGTPPSFLQVKFFLWTHPTRLQYLPIQIGREFPFLYYSNGFRPLSHCLNFVECLLFVRENLVKPAMIPSQSIKHIIHIGQRQKNQSVCQQYVQKVFSSCSSKTGNHSSLSAGGYNSSWPVSLRHALTLPLYG